MLLGQYSRQLIPLRIHRLEYYNGCSHATLKKPASMMSTSQKQIKDAVVQWEQHIVWLEAIDELDYVRIAFVPHRNKKGRIRSPRNGRLISYAEHQPDAPGFHHMRRIFWLKPCDRDNDPTGPYAVNYPDEAVDPRTVKPGVIGYRTDRAKGAANRLMS